MDVGVSAGVTGPSRELWACEDPQSTRRVGRVYRLPGLSLGAAAVVMDLAQREFPDWDKGVGRPGC